MSEATVVDKEPVTAEARALLDKAITMLIASSQALLYQGDIEAFSGIHEALERLRVLEHGDRAQPLAPLYHYHVALYVSIGKAMSFESAHVQTRMPISQEQQIAAIQDEMATEFQPRDRHSGAALIGTPAKVVIVAYTLLRVDAVQVQRPEEQKATQEEAPGPRLVEP